MVFLQSEMFFRLSCPMGGGKEPWIPEQNLTNHEFDLLLCIMCSMWALFEHPFFSAWMGRICFPLQFENANTSLRCISEMGASATTSIWVQTRFCVLCCKFDSVVNLRVSFRMLF